MIRLIRRFLSIADRPLQDRLAALIALAVATCVAVMGVVAYGITHRAIYDRLDADLTTLASFTANWIGEDVETLGGLDPSALAASDVDMSLIRSDNRTITLKNDKTPVPPSAEELAIARLQMGSSARTATDDSGQRYRVVAVPIIVADGRYAIVLERPLANTEAVLQALLWALLGFGGAGVVVAAVIGWIIARSATEPLRRLTGALTHIAETDDLTPLEADSTDELVGLVRAFNTMLRSLASSRERQRRLIADAGHELRTPLTSMRTNVELLVADDKQGMLPEGARAEILRDVAAQLGEFTTLVGDLVHLSRDDRVASVPEPIDLRTVVSSAIERVKRRGPGLVWDVELHPFYLVGEPESLERAITNLLDNAVKFSPANGTIRVHLQGDRLVIDDQGPGIAEEDLPHVFERFYRSEKARNKPGSGLGLSIVAHTVKSHGGWVKAGRSSEGGAEFTIRFPGSTTPPEELEGEG